MAMDAQPEGSTLESQGRRSARKARATDAAAIQRILSEANLSLFSSDDTRTEAWNPNPPNRVHVCEYHGEVVAVVQWRQVAEEVEIFDVAVDANYRRRSFASFLLESVLRLAKTGGAMKAFLEVRESNTAAVALYHKLGFAVTGRRPNYYHHPEEAALLLRLEITA